MSIKKTNCPDLKTAAESVFAHFQNKDAAPLFSLPFEQQINSVQFALHEVFHAEYGPLVLDQSALEKIRESVMNMQKQNMHAHESFQKWQDSREEMEEAICLYLFEEGYESISSCGKKGLQIKKDDTHYDLETLMFEALDSQRIVYDIDPETLEEMKQAISVRHNEFIQAQENIDQRLRDFSTDDLMPS